MAARLNPRHQQMVRDKTAKPWQFYVYAIVDSLGSVAYVGKGSTNRLRSQLSRFKMAGHEIARFQKESHAYDFERQAIAEHAPKLNRCRGGNGGRMHPHSPGRPTNEHRLMDLLGLRRYVAKALLAMDLSSFMPKSEIEALRARLQVVWNGERR